ncbi:telomerase protein component 1 [Tachyglossus aculeatus]|uniref:telomerase protein component 1 n=1 Tax=Tachyglossus aculeatus TaxID=9261 RepID=UPI0018F75B68|nr:telomerase protein component 1 [Tachyglossus aculeatus]
MKALSPPVGPDRPAVLSLENRLLPPGPRLLPSSLASADGGRPLPLPALVQAALRGPDTRNSLLPRSGATAPLWCRSAGPSSIPPPGAPIQDPGVHPVAEETAASGESLPRYSLSLEEEEEEKEEEEGEEGVEGERQPEAPTEDSDQTLQKQKLALLTLLCSSLVSGGTLGTAGDPTREALLRVCTDLALKEPEFILKAALYTRQELNVRVSANLLLAIAAFLPACRPHVRRYFSASVRLPSDWIQVARLFQSLAGDPRGKLVPLPACLRAAMADKFTQFDQYQLRKYLPRAHCAKSRHRAPRHLKSKPPSAQAWRKVGFLMQKFGKKQSEFEATAGGPGVRKKAPREQFTLKKLVQRLHLREPAEHVWALLGYRYPLDLQSFSRSRLPGPWDPHRAGTRMKLPPLDTWERELSCHGNTGSSWERIIDSGQLPYMALLRNLRNVLRAGVSAGHHELLLRRLGHAESVIRSRQFPFRFLSAYKVITDLESQLELNEKPPPSNAALLRKLFPVHFRWVRNRRKLRAALAMPVLFEQLQREKARLRKARLLRSDKATLARYRDTLQAAMELSVRHTLPPLLGRTLVICWTGYSSLLALPKGAEVCCPRPEGNRSEPITILEAGLLLAVMVTARAEWARVLLCAECAFSEEEVGPGKSVLDSVLQLQAKAQALPNGNEPGPRQAASYLMDLVTQQMQVNTVLSFGLLQDPEFEAAQQLVWQRLNPSCLFVSVDLAGKGQRSPSDNPNDVRLNGCSDQLLKFIAERGASRLLDHVGHIDEAFQLPSPRSGDQRRPRPPLEDSIPGPLPPAGQHSWRSVRLFVSSTFRDMQAERDLLLRAVLPALQARAAAHRLRLRLIDLRWGVPEEEQLRGRQLELCLGEVHNSQLLVAMLGTRYGHVPSTYSLPALPHFHWAQDYPAGRSVTEMEVMQFLSVPQRAPAAFVYLRDPDFLSLVPDAWREDFAPESEEAARRVSELKSHLERRKGVTCRRYPCMWGGTAGGRPVVSGLEQFGQMILRDMWMALQRLFLQPESGLDGQRPADTDPVKAEDTLQNAFQQLQSPPSPARPGLLQDTVRRLRRHKGVLSVVSGEPGQGKTAFLASLVSALQAPRQGDAAPPLPIFFHFAGARPDHRRLSVMLRRLHAHLSRLLGRTVPPPSGYRALLWSVQMLLPEAAEALPPGQTLVLVIDGADRLEERSGRLSADWIPETLPQRVHVVLSLAAPDPEDSALGVTLLRRLDAHAVALGPLEPAARARLVREELSLYGKRLEESPFNNQMRLLLLKRGAGLPLYLTLAADHLRLHAVFEQVSERLRTLPATLPLLLQHLLGDLERELGPVVHRALAALRITRSGLTVEELHGILSAWAALPQGAGGWAEAMAAGSNGEPLPLGPFTYLVRSLRSLQGTGLLEAPGTRLCLPPGPLRTAAEQRARRETGLDRTAHTVIAAQLWAACDPDASDTFQGRRPEALVDLPYHLVQGGNRALLARLLTNLYVLAAHAELGLLPALGEAYALYEGSEPPESPEPPDSTLVAFRSFMQSEAALLARHPALLVQQTANQPPDSPLCLQASGLASSRDSREPRPRPGRQFRWINKPRSLKAQRSSPLTLALPSPATALGISPNGRCAAVGTADGVLRLLDLRSWQEEQSLVSGCDGISACIFLSDSTIYIAAFDGVLELWDLQGSGCRIQRTQAHQLHITGCGLSLDRKLLATVSLDGALKLWDTTGGRPGLQHTAPGPLSCVTFHSKEQLVATGGWDGSTSVLRLDDLTVYSVLGAPGPSVQAVTFAPSGLGLVVGRLDGAVELWAWREGVQLATFSAHCGGITAALFLHAGRCLLTTGEDGKVQVWSGSLGKPRGSLGSTHLSPALAVALSPDGAHVAVGHQADGIRVYTVSGTEVVRCAVSDVSLEALGWLSPSVLVAGGSDGALRGWSLGGGKLQALWLLHGHQGPVLGLATSSQLLASASGDFTVRLWPVGGLLEAQGAAELPTGLVLRCHTGPVTCCSFSPDGQYLASGSRDWSLLCWKVDSTGTASLTHSFPACHRDWITGCAWTPDYLLLSCSNDGLVQLWSPTSGQRLGQFQGHQGAVSAVLSVEDHVVSVDRDGILKVWNRMGVELTSIPAHPGPISQCVAALKSHSADGQTGSELLVVTAGLDGTARLWCPLLVSQTQTLLGHSGSVVAAAVSEASGSLLTTSRDGSVRLWTVPEETEQPSEARQPPRPITAVSWAPDGALAVSGNEAGELILWREASPVASAQAPGRVCSLSWVSRRSFVLLSDDHDVSEWEVAEEAAAEGSLSLQLCHSRQRPAPFISGLELTPDGRTLLLGKPPDQLLLLEPGTTSSKTFQLPCQHNGLSGFSTHKEHGVFLLKSLSPCLLSVLKQSESGEMDSGLEFELELERPQPPVLWVTQAVPESGCSFLCASSEGLLWRLGERDPDGEWAEGDIWQQRQDCGKRKLEPCLRRKIHAGAVTALHVLPGLLLTAAKDRDVKLWERPSLRLRGLFRCEGAVSCLAPRPGPAHGLQLAVGDAMGNIYFLAWE